MKDVLKIRRLPGYWLGTRKPTDLGYQPNLGIGTPEYTSVLGEDFSSEARAAQRNILPEGLLKLTQNIQQPAVMLSNYISSTGNSAGSAAGSAAGSTAAKAGLSTAGKVAGGIGAAYGLYNMYTDFARANDTRSAGDMAKTLTTNTYYTPGGHAFTKHSGLNMQSELDYANARKTSNRLGLTLDAMGTGAGIGGLAGGLYGMAIGAAGGMLFGGISSLAGFGDTSEETIRQGQLLAESTARSDRQSETLAKNLDTREGFYNRGNSRYGAADGKKPVFSAFGPVDKEATARVSNGELVGNFEDGYVSEVPGKPNNKDSKLAWLRPSDFVISNKFGLSDYAKATGDYAGALNMQDILMTQYKNNYKCGKLPKYAIGTIGEYALSTLPHMNQYFSSLKAYNRAKNANTAVQQYEGYNGLGTSAINQMYSDMIDPREYFIQSDRLYNLADWDNRRNPALGYGGRAIFGNDLYRKKLAADADLWLKVQEANRALKNTAGNLKYNYGDRLLGLNYDNFWKRYAAQQQANAAKENWMAQYEKNQVLAGINAAADLLRMNDKHNALAMQNRLLNLYDRQMTANEDWVKSNYNPNTTSKKKNTDDRYAGNGGIG